MPRRRKVPWTAVLKACEDFMSDSWIRKMYFRQKKVTKWWRVIEKLVAENIELKQKERRARRAMVNLAARYKLELEYEVPGVPWGKDDDWELWDEFVEAGELGGS